MHRPDSLPPAGDRFRSSGGRVLPWFLFRFLLVLSLLAAFLAGVAVGESADIAQWVWIGFEHICGPFDPARYYSD